MTKTSKRDLEILLDAFSELPKKVSFENIVDMVAKNLKRQPIKIQDRVQKMLRLGQLQGVIGELYGEYYLIEMKCL